MKIQVAIARKILVSGELQKNSPADASTGVIFISPARVNLISSKGVSPACPKGSNTRAFSNDGEIYILCGQNQISWFDVRNIPSEIDLMTEEDLDNYDLSQENADAIVDIGM